LSTEPVWKIEFIVPTEHGDLFAEAIEPFCGALTTFLIEKTEESQFSGYSFEAPDEVVLRKALRRAAEEVGIFAPTADMVLLPETDWVAENQAHFEPVRAGRFYVHDSYHLNPAPAGAVPILVDAATAFGTGHHGTTRGCLEALEQLVRAGAVMAPILDLGCGTGILGIAAAKALRMPVIATDIDPVAVSMAKANVRLNGVLPYVNTFKSRGLEAIEARRQGPYGLIFANILARPLQGLASSIAANLALGAPVILSGLLQTQEQQVLSAYLSQGLSLRARMHRDEWSTLICS
jgi:ribosomal protein L11 methyltransferase